MSQQAWQEFDEDGRMKHSSLRERVVDVMEEHVKFTRLVREHADFLVDRDLRVWLTEVQEGPGLSHAADDEPVKRRFVPRMVTDAAQIGVEAARRRAAGRSLAGIEAGTGFELLDINM